MIFFSKLLEKRRRKKLDYYYEQYQKYYKEYRWRKDSINRTNSFYYSPQYTFKNDGDSPCNSLKEQCEAYHEKAQYYKKAWRKMQKKLNLR